MDHKTRCCVAVSSLLIALLTLGCQSPYHADRGALFGGLLGAGTGAIVGDAAGNAGAGTAIGAGLGALTGAVVGSELDEMEARNRAMIAQQLGREVAAGAVTTDDVIAMTRAGVNEDLIVNHVNIHGVAVPLQPSDIIYLQQQGVSTRVIKAMQTPPRQPAQPVVVQQPAATPVIVEEYHYGPPYWGPPWRPCYSYHWRPRPRPGVSWGMSFHN
jgi:hypothetical protein